jgi:spore coat polysaccharide biosynthesis predicted glycosyltransferase SpsG
MAPFWTDQINLVTQIAKSLPLRFKLYIKEHPAMVGYRTRGYYKKLKKIPNVKLIDADFPSFDLVQKTKLVITITGTVGWEAILSKKPVITFGYVNYNKLSTVKKCENIEQLPCLVKEQLENFQSDEKELLNFIGAIMEESVEAGLGEIWERRVEPAEEKVRLAMLVDLMAKKLNLAQSKIIN